MRTGQVWRRTGTPDGLGGTTPTWVRLSDVDVAVGVVNPDEVDQGEREGVVVGVPLKFPIGAAVSRGDRIVVDAIEIEIVWLMPHPSAAVLEGRGRIDPFDDLRE